MFNIDFLAKVGLGPLPEDQKISLLGQINKEHEIRVGRRLTEGMDKHEIVGLENMIIADQQGALNWIAQNRPAYQQIVIEEARKIRRELLINRDKILLGVQS